MVSVDLIAMVTSEASDGHERRLRVKVTSEASYGYERRLRAKRVMVVFNDTPMEEGSGVFFLTAHFVIPVSSLLWRKVLECSSSYCSLRHPCVLTHSYGGRFWSVLPHPAHFVIPVISLLWRKVLECSSSLLTSSSLCPHSLRHPCVLTHFVIPVFSHP